jgi:hypothetical protein
VLALRVIRRPSSVLALGAVVVGLTACGPPPPQAPLPYAKKLDSATSGISTACGKTAQLTEFPGDHRRDLNSLEATASDSARKLAVVFKRNPEWIYQGETVRQIVADGASMLGSCGLPRARAVLLHATVNS